VNLKREKGELIANEKKKIKNITFSISLKKRTKTNASAEKKTETALAKKGGVAYRSAICGDGRRQKTFKDKEGAPQNGGGGKNPQHSGKKKARFSSASATSKVKTQQQRRLFSITYRRRQVAEESRGKGTEYPEKKKNRAREKVKKKEKSAPKSERSSPNGKRGKKLKSISTRIRGGS